MVSYYSCDRLLYETTPILSHSALYNIYISLARSTAAGILVLKNMVLGPNFSLKIPHYLHLAAWSPLYNHRTVCHARNIDAVVTGHVAIVKMPSLVVTWMPSSNLWRTKSQRAGLVYHTVLPRKACCSSQVSSVCVTSV